MLLKKNENRCYRLLMSMYPDVEIKHPYHIKEKIYDEDGKLIRNYILVDFYMKIGDVEWAVEYNGGQHFRIVKKWGGAIGAKEKLRQQKIRDKWLKNYCLEHNIRLISIDGRKIRGEKKIKAELKKQFKSLNKKAPKNI